MRKLYLFMIRLSHDLMKRSNLSVLFEKLFELLITFSSFLLFNFDALKMLFNDFSLLFSFFLFDALLELFLQGLFFCLSTGKQLFLILNFLFKLLELFLYFLDLSRPTIACKRI